MSRHPPSSDPAESLRRGILTAAAAVALQIAILLALGQPVICTCGTVKLWHGAVLSAENSQHLTDWYTLTHVIHGLAFYFVLWLVAPRTSVAIRLSIAVAVESAWEIIENTPFIVERYRQSALAQGYRGDSVINSVFDTLAAASGFLLARALPRQAAVGLLLSIELFLIFMIRDGLSLNIAQLVYPSQAIARWQAGH